MTVLIRAFAAALPVVLAGCSSFAGGGASPTMQVVSSYEDCVLKGTAALPKTQADRVTAAEAACQAPLDDYRQRYVALGASTDVTNTAVGRLVDKVRAAAQKLSA